MKDGEEYSEEEDEDALMDQQPPFKKQKVNTGCPEEKSGKLKKKHFHEFWLGEIKSSDSIKEFEVLSDFLSVPS